LNSRVRNNLWFAYLAALLVWSVQAYGFMGKEERAGKLFAYVQDAHPYISDFVNVYNAAVLAKMCSPVRVAIYDPAVQAASANKLTAPVQAEQPFYLQTPPYFFSIAEPLANLTMLQAWLVWCGFSLIVFAAALWFFARQIFPDNFSRLFVIIATIGSFPEWEGVRSGNSSLWLAPGVVAMWLLIRRHPALAACCASVCLIKIQYLPLVGMTGLFLGGLPFVGTLLAITLALLAWAFATVGAENILAFPRALAGAEASAQVSGVAANEMQNFRGQLCLLIGNDGSLVHLLSLAILVVAVICLSIMWWRFIRLTASQKVKATISGPDLERKFKIYASITTLLLLICSPHTHKHDYTLVVVPAVWLWQTVVCQSDEGKNKSLRFPAMSWVFFMLEFLFHLVKIQPMFLWALTLCLTAFMALKVSPRSLDGPDISE